jgi:DNA polymerase-4
MLTKIFTWLCTHVAEDLQRKGYVGRTIGIKLRFEDFHTVTRDMTLPTLTADGATIRRAAGECLRRIPLDKKLRLLGVRVSTLTSTSAAQEPAASPQGELPLASGDRL